MPNMYDVAYDLEKALRGSDEFTQLKSAYDAVESDEAAKKLFENFRRVQLELQQKQMQGVEPTQEEIEKAQQHMQLIQQHEKISKLMELEQNMSVFISDINKIIMKPLEELYGAAE